MELNQKNYFSVEANKKFMSVSQYKSFCQCEAATLHNLEIPEENKSEALLEGHLFEELVAGDAETYLSEHPELISSTGKTKGELKANYKTVLKSAEKFNSQKFFRSIIDKCDKQLILTGEIEGVAIKCALDLFDKKTNSIYDIKCMKDFKEQWSSEEKKYIPWYYHWGYVLQLAIYREIVRQNFGEPKEIGLLAASKEAVPDIEANSFSSDLLDIELQEFKSKVKHFDNIKKGLEPARCCGTCNYCKSIKEINNFILIK